MAISANSYGSVAEVEALTPRYLDGGSYDADTQPTLTQVETFIDRVSGILNVLLAQAGFVVPVTQADAKLALDDFAVDQAVQLCHAVRGSGPYAPGSTELRGRRARTVILEEAYAFVERYAAGLEALGAERTRTLTEGLACREQDDSGDDLVPPFQREMVGHEIVDWDDE
jgi:hypothetical protein